MKAQLCRMLAALLCVCTVTGCSANKEMPTGYLTTITKKEHRTTVIEPVWLQPDEGRVTPVCDEEHHGADCPFYGMDESVRSYLTRDDDTIYYVTETAADSGEKTATLWEYTIRNGRTKRIDSRTDTLWRSKTLMKDGYLFQWERDAAEERYDLTCMALPDRAHEKRTVMEIPQTIRPSKSGKIAYYLMDDAAGYPCGFYSADWKFTAKPPTRTLLFYDAKCRITGIWFEDDAIYWRGQLRYDAESDEQTLYRYDPKTCATTEVCSLYSGTQMIGRGDFFYYIHHTTTPGGESRCEFSRLRKSTGESKVLETLPDGWRSDTPPQVYGAWILFRVRTASESAETGAEAFYCWNTDTGAGKLIPAAVS